MMHAWQTTTTTATSLHHGRSKDSNSFERNQEMSIETDTVGTMFRTHQKGFFNHNKGSLPNAMRPPIGMGDKSRKQLSPINRPLSATEKKSKHHHTGETRNHKENMTTHQSMPKIETKVNFTNSLSETKKNFNWVNDFNTPDH